MHYSEEQVKYLLKEQRRLCAEFGTHLKYGVYKYKPAKMIAEAPEPPLYLPDDFLFIDNFTPHNGEEVYTLSNLGNKFIARYEELGDQVIWETSYDFAENETVIGWKRP